MQKADNTIVRETKYIAFFVIAMSIIMQLVFVFVGCWTYKVLLGNALSAAVSIANFYWMGLSVQKAVVQDEADARKTIRTSQSLRTFFMFVFVVLGVVVPCFSTLSVIIPLFFTRIAIAFRPLVKNKIN